MSICQFLLIAPAGALLTAVAMRGAIHYARKHICWVCFDPRKSVTIQIGGHDHAEPTGICEACIAKIERGGKERDHGPEQ